ncbi:MAG: hypothetical protein COA96_14995 [SAR86 cluster bacterium]|uniref:SHOCT domain-containing protein n=1 Tax=SAR86 cluster bacterium TaxID=2030880 RepID=A0A2A5ARY0_9GAMM|nr:MAG: hypothetical protein COA96_14995 [SAR86 cluster bacterium]
MGYKGSMRSVVAASRAISREAERSRKATERGETQIRKKIDAINEKQNKVFDAVRELYAKGKITEEEYRELEKRKEDVQLDLIIFGKAAGVALGKRYICGKIDKKEFERIKDELLPVGYVDEKIGFEDALKHIKSDTESFKQRCSTESEENICQKCGNKGSWFKKIHQYFELSLCGKCKSELKRIRTYPMFDGEYIAIESFIVGVGESNLRIKQEYL